MHSFAEIPKDVPRMPVLRMVVRSCITMTVILIKIISRVQNQATNNHKNMLLETNIPQMNRVVTVIYVGMFIYSFLGWLILTYIDTKPHIPYQNDIPSLWEPIVQPLSARVLRS